MPTALKLHHGFEEILNNDRDIKHIKNVSSEPNLSVQSISLQESYTCNKLCRIANTTVN